MSIVWLIPVTILAMAAGAFARARRRRTNHVPFPQDPVSGEWLAQARSREEHRW